MSIERGANLDRFSGLSPEGAGLATSMADRISGEAANMRNVGLGYAQLGQQGQIAMAGLAQRKSEAQAELDQQALDRQYGLVMSQLGAEQLANQRELKDALDRGSSDGIAAARAKIAETEQKRREVSMNKERVQMLHTAHTDFASKANAQALRDHITSETVSRQVARQDERRSAMEQEVTPMVMGMPDSAGTPGTAPAGGTPGAMGTMGPFAFGAGYGGQPAATPSGGKAPPIPTAPPMPATAQSPGGPLAPPTTPGEEIGPPIPSGNETTGETPEVKARRDAAWAEWQAGKRSEPNIDNRYGTAFPDGSKTALATYPEDEQRQFLAQRALDQKNAGQPSAVVGQEGPSSGASTAKAQKPIEKGVAQAAAAGSEDAMDGHVQTMAARAMKAYLQPQTPEEAQAIETMTRAIYTMAQVKKDDPQYDASKRAVAQAVHTLVQTGHSQTDISMAFSMFHGAALAQTNEYMKGVGRGVAETASGATGNKPMGLDPKDMGARAAKGKVLMDKVSRFTDAASLADLTVMENGEHVGISPFMSMYDYKKGISPNNNDNFSSLVSRMMSDMYKGRASVDFNDPEVIKKLGGSETAGVVRQAMDQERQRMKDLIERNGGELQDGKVTFEVAGHKMQYTLDQLGPTLTQFEAQERGYDEALRPQNQEDMRAREVELETRGARETYRNKAVGTAMRMNDVSGWLERNKVRLK